MVSTQLRIPSVHFAGQWGLSLMIYSLSQRSHGRFTRYQFASHSDGLGVTIAFRQCETLLPLKVRIMLVCEIDPPPARQKRKKVFFVETVVPFDSLCLLQSEQLCIACSSCFGVLRLQLNAMTCRIHVCSSLSSDQPLSFV